MIVILNGVSSSGKSTLAKMIQDRSGFPFYRLDIDDFILMAPEKFNDYDNKDFSVQFNFPFGTKKHQNGDFAPRTLLPPSPLRPIPEFIGRY